MSTYRVPKCGRHFVKFDDVTIYPVLVVARTVESNTAIAATQRNKRYLCFSRMAQERGFRQRLNCCGASANREKNSFRVTRPMFSRVVRVSRNDMVETSSSSCLVICRRAFVVV